MKILGFQIGRVLNKAETAPSAGGVALSQLVDNANRWREQNNPLRSITVALAVSWLEEEMRGIYANLQWGYHYIEKTDPDLLALVELRTSAIEELDWNIKLVEGAEKDPRAIAQRDALEAAYERFQNLYGLVGHLAMSTFRSFAIAQPVNANGDLSWTDAVRFDLLPQWNFARDGQNGALYWNPGAHTVAGGTAGATLKIEPKDIIYREHTRPVDRIGLVKFIRANLCEKDWDSFCEVYGIEQPVVIGPSNIPTEKEAEYKNAAANVANGGGGFLPNGSDVKYPNSQKREAPFKARLDHLSEKLILAGTGGKLKMLAESGSGTLAGGAHSDTFAQIARAEARKISEVLQRQFDARFLAAKFPGQPVLAYFELAAKETQDIGTVIDHAVKLAQAGFALDPAEIEQRTGYKVTVKPAEPAQQSGAVLNKTATSTSSGQADEDRTGEFLANARDRVAGALQADLQPVAEALAKLLPKVDAGGADAVAALKAFRDEELPKLLKGEPEATVKAFQESLAASFLNGLTDRKTGGAS